MTDDSMISTHSARRRPRSTRRIGAISVLAVLTLGACTSDPGPKRVAQDIIKAEAFANPDLDEECMLAVVEGYEPEELEAIANDLDSTNADTVEAGQSALDEYQAALASCND